MKVIHLNAILGTERAIARPGWEIRHLLLKQDGMGFSMHEIIIQVGAGLHLWYKHRLEAVYCVSGDGSIEDLGTGEVHPICEGVLYAVNHHERYILRGGSRNMRLVCAFNPPLTGNEIGVGNDFDEEVTEAT
ncbi:MAG: ectoine synthase [Methylohalobius sp. ZOD2]